MSRILKLVALVLIVIGMGALVFGIVGRGFTGSDQQKPGSSQSTTRGKAQVGGPFQLLDKNGAEVTDMNYRGKYMLVYFGYTFCPDVCPTSLGEMSDAMDLLSPAQREKVVPIFISVDPARDTPEVVGDYVTHFHESMVGLSGTVEGVTAAAKAYRAYFSLGDADAQGNYPVDHTSYTYLMGPDGQFVTAFRHATPGKKIAEALASMF